MSKQKLDVQAAKILTEENVKAMEYMYQQMRVFNKVMLNMKSMVRKEESKNRTEIAALLGLKLNDAEFFQVGFVGDEARNYFITQLLKHDLATAISQKYMGYDGTKLNENYRLSSSHMKVKGERIAIKPFSILVKYKDLEFLFMPASPKNWQDTTAVGVAWVCCKRDELEQVLLYVEELKTNYDAIKNSVCTLGNEFTIVDHKEKFSLESVVVTPYIKAELDLVVDMFNNFKKLEAAGVPFKRGILFAGPPGTGKTTAVNALTRDVLKAGGTVFIMSSAADWPIEKVYRFAERFKPALVVLEDFDIIASQRQMQHGGGVSSELLNILEGASGLDGVITVATTNRLDVLDEAATRHGRIDKIYAMDIPNLDMKVELLRLHLELYKVSLHLDKAVTSLRQFLEKGVTGAAISSVVLGAKQKAVSRDREVTISDLLWSAEGVRKQEGKLGF